MRMITETATTQVATLLLYSVKDPYAVRLVFDGDASPIEWIFARDLLAAGLDTACGDGDVRVWSAESSDPVFLELRSPSGHAVFAADRGLITGFLALTEQVVPRGGETAVMAMDHHLALLLGGDPGLIPPEPR